MRITTGYSDVVYRIISIERGCTCPDYVDQISMREPPPRPPHLHLVVLDVGTGEKCFLGGFDEATLRRVWARPPVNPENRAIPVSKDFIEVLPDDEPVQLSVL